MKYILKRTLKVYEHCEVEADSFQDAVDKWLDNPDDLEWENSQLGDDYDVNIVEDENGDERDVDENGQVQD